MNASPEPVNDPSVVCTSRAIAADMPSAANVRGDAGTSGRSTTAPWSSARPASRWRIGKPRGGGRGQFGEAPLRAHELRGRQDFARPDADQALDDTMAGVPQPVDLQQIDPRL